MIAQKTHAATASENPMRKILLEKITLNIGAGTEAENVDKAMALLNKITGAKIVKTVATRRIPTWKVRLGLPVGAMVTVRGQKAADLLKAMLKAVENKIKKGSFTKNGFSFGIKEYIEIPGVKYDSKIGILGLEVAVSLRRAGFHIKRRRIKRTRVHPHHEISSDESFAWAQQNFGVQIKEEE